MSKSKGKKKVPVKKKPGSEIVTTMNPDDEKLEVRPLDASSAATVSGEGLLRNGLSGGFLTYMDVYKRRLDLQRWEGSQEKFTLFHMRKCNLQMHYPIFGHLVCL